MKHGENEFRRDVHGSDGVASDGNASDGDARPGLTGASCQVLNQVLSQGEIGSLIAMTVATNLALAHRRGDRSRLALHGECTTERRYV